MKLLDIQQDLAVQYWANSNPLPQDFGHNAYL